MITRETYYFPKPGPENTDFCLGLLEKAVGQGYSHLVVPSTTGASGALVRVRCTFGCSAEALVRVTLLDQRREIASSQLGDHAVVFEAIPPGRYLLHFASQACELGRYTFEIVDQA